MIASSNNLVRVLGGLATLLFFITLIGRMTQTETWPTITEKIVQNVRPKTSKGPSALQERLRHADRLWRQSVQDRKVMAAQVGVHEFPEGYINPFNVWDFVRPSFFCPFEIERVGNIGDGGKWVCGMSHYQRHSPGPSRATNPAEEVVMYSFGVNDDSSFEARMLERTNAVIWGYDFSVEDWAGDITPNWRPRATFKKAAIGKQTTIGSDPPYYAIQDLMRMNGHDFIDIMKMDIEGAEFDALTSLMNHVEATWDSAEEPILPVGQLLLEIHIIGGELPFGMPKTMQVFLDWWAVLERMGMRPVFNEHNWIGDFFAAHGVPRFIEYTFINARHPANKLIRDV